MLFPADSNDLGWILSFWNLLNCYTYEGNILVTHFVNRSVQFQHLKFENTKFVMPNVWLIFCLAYQHINGLEGRN